LNGKVWTNETLPNFIKPSHPMERENKELKERIHNWAKKNKSPQPGGRKRSGKKSCA
jgi:hypothetical protein